LAELLQLAFDNVVIVAPGGIGGDEAALLLLQQCDGIISGGVALADEDRAPRLRPQRLRMLAAVLRHPVHVAVAAFAEKFLQARTGRPHRSGGRDADGVEAERGGALLEG
jgi:hypothetical protein